MRYIFLNFHMKQNPTRLSYNSFYPIRLDYEKADPLNTGFRLAFSCKIMDSPF